MPGLICPHCGVATAFNPVMLTDVKEGPESRFSIKYILDNFVSFLYAPAIVESKSYKETDYAILECTACSETYIATKKYKYSAWVTSFPIPETNVSEDIPEKVRTAFKEAHLCYAVKAYSACLLMCRTALIRLQRDQGVGTEGLISPQEQGKISLSLFQMANEVRLWANVAGHEDIASDTISPEDCEDLLVIWKTY